MGEAPIEIRPVDFQQTAATFRRRLRFQWTIENSNSAPTPLRSINSLPENMHSLFW